MNRENLILEFDSIMLRKSSQTQKVKDRMFFLIMWKLDRKKREGGMQDSYENRRKTS